VCVCAYVCVCVCKRVCMCVCLCVYKCVSGDGIAQWSEHSLLS